MNIKRWGAQLGINNSDLFLVGEQAFGGDRK
jgi:hypothetical protein